MINTSIAARCRTVIWAAVAVCLLSPWAWAGSTAPPDDLRQFPQPVIDGLHRILERVGPGPVGAVSPASVAAVIDFVMDTASDRFLYHAGDAFSAPSAYHRFDVDMDMARFLKLAFDPGIPAYAFAPTSVRLSKWMATDRSEASFPVLWRDLDTLSAPRVYRGLEYMENTPDTHSGAYYTYDLYRTVILMRYRGQIVLLSLTKQTDVSDTGKKGVVLGGDDNWAYLYSGEDGLTVPGMGWVRSYMYDSYSVNVYIQPAEGPPMVRCGIYKWVRAGWASINMVQPHHIYAGLKRFSDSFSAIVTDPQLPSHGHMATVFKRIDRTDETTLRETYRRYLSAIGKTFGESPSFPRKWYDAWFRSSDYLDQVTPDQMRAALVIEYVRQLQGKPPCMDVTPFIAAR